MKTHGDLHNVSPRQPRSGKNNTTEIQSRPSLGRVQEYQWTRRIDQRVTGRKAPVLNTTSDERTSWKSARPHTTAITLLIAVSHATKCKRQWWNFHCICWAAHIENRLPKPAWGYKGVAYSNWGVCRTMRVPVPAIYLITTSLHLSLQ